MSSKAKDVQSVNYRLDLVTQHYYLGIVISLTEINAVFSNLTYQMPASSIIHLIMLRRSPASLQTTDGQCWQGSSRGLAHCMPLQCLLVLPVSVCPTLWQPRVTAAAKVTQQGRERRGEVPDTRNFRFPSVRIVYMVLSTHFHTLWFTITLLPGAVTDANLPMPGVASQDRKPAPLLFETLWCAFCYPF